MRKANKYLFGRAHNISPNQIFPFIDVFFFFVNSNILALPVSSKTVLKIMDYKKQQSIICITTKKITAKWIDVELEYKTESLLHTLGNPDSFA